MKTVQFNKLGGPEVLQVIKQEIPFPADHEVVIKVKAAGLNQAEQLFFQGQYLFQPQFPSTLGFEASGIVEKVGANVNEFRPGDEVCLTPNIMPYEYGYLGEYVLAPKEAVIHKPASVSFEEGAAFWMTYGTAYGGLVLRGKLQAGQTVLITAGSSGVGIAAIQMARHLGARVITTTRTSSKKEFLEKQGADLVIVTTEDSLIEQIREFTDDKGFQLAFDPIAGTFLSEIAEAAAMEAHIVLYGVLSLELDAPFPLFPTFAKGLHYSGLHLMFHVLQHPDRFEAMKDALLKGLEQGAYTPVIDKKFVLDQVKEAYEYMQSNQQQGKILGTI